ncbi:HET-domain-containing protein [Hypoxylon sp. FL0890]|nr:HET-domain-containing protein [Hypoxylon sp. FL0890]
MVRYRYSTLPEKDYLRLVTLYPAKFEDDIVISFDTSPFPRGGSLRYEALSYVWGSNRDPLPVYVSRRGVTTTTALQNGCRTRLPQILATQNLVVALRHLRYVDRPRIMWIDALCINQADQVEKGPQVAMMGEIYRLAHRVVAWLGPEENDSNHAMELMDYLGAEVDVNFTSGALSPAENCTDPSLGDINTSLNFNPRKFLSSYHLILRVWFDRLWIRQEIYLANSEAIIMCGFCQVKWTSFRRGLACLHRKSYRVPVGVSLSQSQFDSRKSVLEGIIYRSDASVMDLRRGYRNSHCADPRDRIYAVLSLLPEWERALIPQPDYTQPYIDLYKQVTTRYIQSSDSLDILGQCELQDGMTHPSWVPDWSKSSNVSLAVVPQAFSSQLTPWYDFPRPGVLRVACLVKTKVEKYYQFPHFEDSSRDVIFEEIRKLLIQVHVEKRYTVEDYARTIVSDRFTDSYDPPDDRYADIDTVKKLVELMMSDYQFNSDDFGASSPLSRILDGATQISGTRLVLATEDYLGIGPESAEPGDVVSVALGCSEPLLLRPLGNNTFRLVGPCFVVGIGNGDALLGPLPEEIRAVQAISKNEWECLAFKNVLSGEIVCEDPRLESLPVGLTEFRRCLSQGLHAGIYVEPDMLRERGVDLEYFDIV